MWVLDSYLIMMEWIYNLCYRLSPLELLIRPMLGHEIGLILTRTLLITDVTRLQPFTLGGDNFQENIEMLISYNVRTNGIQQDCLYIEQGHLMTPTTFMTYSMAVDPRQSVVVTWTPIKRYSMPRDSRLSSPPGSPFYTSC